MPELAEVDFFRRRWDVGLGVPILRVELHPHARVFRGEDVTRLQEGLTGVALVESFAHGKQMLFAAERSGWLGIHLAMTGDLRVEPEDYAATRHDHFILRQRGRALVFSDPRMFGRIRFDVSPDGPPEWWRGLPPAILSNEFTTEHVAAFLKRRARSPLKAVLLDQAGFPGVGNWMADEILWQLGWHPLTLAGSLTPPQITALRKKARQVARGALRTIGVDWTDPPADTWLIRHRWAAGQQCPRCQTELIREEAAGRTTCWCPTCQPPPAGVPILRKPVRTGYRRERPKLTSESLS